MRIIFVHGISQENKNAEIIKKEWLDVLSDSFKSKGLDSLVKLSSVSVPFYGKRLFELSSAKFKDEAIALGAEEAEADFDGFAVKALGDIALKLGATESEIEDEKAQTVVAQGAGMHKKSLKAIARVIERISPWNGVLALRFLGQAHAYIRNLDTHDQVNDLVRPAFEGDEDVIIISHSLGTIVSYSLLREFASKGKPISCPLFITLGSPLGIQKIREAFALPRVTPPDVKRWVNGSDPSDFVALHGELTKDNFGAQITNFIDFKNGYDNPHSITEYLKDRRIAEEIHDAIN